MVSFSCENCGDVLTKKKLDPHRNHCHGATFTCIDCMVYFPGTEYRSHTSCITEDQKYQGALYKPKREKRNQNQPQSEYQSQSRSQNQIPVTPAAPKQNSMAHMAYVEDVPEDFEAYRVYDSDDATRSRRGPMPHAPTPPPAGGDAVNVFDFFVGGPTPKASNTDLRAEAAATAGTKQPSGESDALPSESNQLVRFSSKTDVFDDENRVKKSEDGTLVQYGTGPVPASNMQTPAPRLERKKSHKDSDGKKDKKRKRLHVDTSDISMTDAPPMLHSGLTGGLKGLMRGPSVFPPSPEYSADAAETPASPLKKSRHSKHSKGRSEGIGNNLMAMIANSTKPKSSSSKKRKASSSSSGSKKHSSHSASSRHHHHSSSSKPTTNGDKLIEYRPGSKDSRDGHGDKSAVVVFGNNSNGNTKKPADLLLSFVNKGPDSERGCSMNKALKRFHRERSVSGSAVAKLMDEKELWRSLRMRKNERGEIVLFCI